ncbi:PREDICTED: neural/ectodermal development factor IMP-L2-like, partial [Papilio polytes]|uniref:neural/ectodermal development factor IMP-L2-like n=1 Tax=Papilio polytes TaxID=76194 RepID=UPI0006760C9A
AGLLLVCEVAAAPAPQIQWLKNGEPFIDYEEEANEIPTVSSNVARLVSKLVVSAARDGDVFTCDANNGLKEVTASTTVYTENELSPQLLLGKLFPLPSKPVITLHYEEIVLPSGDLLIVELQWGDMGEWTCSARSAQGKDTATTFVYPSKPKKQ